jgi:hypothetical protein
MIEKTLISYLSAKLKPIKVYAEVPEKAPATFIVIEQTGRGQKDTINRTVLAIQSYAPSLLKAAELSERVIGAMVEMPLSENIGKVELVSEHNFTDIRTKQYRYQAVVAISY